MAFGRSTGRSTAAHPLLGNRINEHCIVQLVGHAIEGKPPELFRDWRFLFVGLR
jgi:hypothetical protein